MNKALTILLLSALAFPIGGTANSSELDVSTYRAALFTYGGIPQSSNHKQKILINNSYVVGYSETYKNPLWVAYRLGNYKNDLNVQNWERPYRFITDYRTKSVVSHDDYTSSGYHRGHMAPNAGLLYQYGQLAQIETYLMTNICPQKPDLNTKIWADIEEIVRDEVSQDDSKGKEVHSLYVITGPIFEKNPPEKLESGVSIPTSFYKIITYRRGYIGTVKSVALKLPQEPGSDEIFDYVTTVDDIEAATGINFFPDLSERKQENLESVKLNFKHEIVQ